MSDDAMTVDQINELLGKSPFISFMNLTCTEIDLDAGPSISMTMPMRPEFERGAGTNQFHGGPIASFIDTVGDYALVVGLKAGVIPAVSGGAIHGPSPRPVWRDDRPLSSLRALRVLGPPDGGLRLTAAGSSAPFDAWGHSGEGR